MLERILYSLLWLLILGGIGYAGYFGYTKLNHDFVYESDGGDVVVDNNVEPIALNFGNEETDNTNVTDPAAEVNSGDNNNPGVDENDPANVENNNPNNSSTSPAVPAGDHSALIARAEGLVDYNKSMKVGSQGTRVGTVQDFLNLYHGTSDVVDNQYGNGTKAAVQKFQEMENLPGPDGLAGPATYQAMVDWLKG